MRAGKMDRVVAVLRNIEVGRSDLREPVFENSIIRRVWAEVERSGDSETTIQNQRVAVETVTVRCRYFAGLLATDLLEIDGNTFEITGSHETGRREGLEIKAERRR